MDNRKADGQNSTTPYNTRGSSASKDSRSISSRKVNSNTITGHPHSARFRQRLPFMDNVADQENSSSSVGDHSASVVSNTPKSHQSQANFKQQHIEPRPATPFSLRKQIALALELSRDRKCSISYQGLSGIRVRVTLYFSSKCSTDKNTFEMDVQS